MEQDIIRKNNFGQLSYCKDCGTFHLTFSNILIELSEKWLERKFECEKILLDSGLSRADYKYNKNRKGSSNQIWERIN